MKACCVIPVRNHGPMVAPVVEAVVAAGLPCLLVDDGSDAPTPALLAELSARLPGVEVLTHPVNRGKGAAVRTGARRAAERGFDTFVQIDADGQHDTADLPRFLAEAAARPGTLVLGRPVYDASVPRVRFYCRYLTHVLVWLECLSLDLADTMCGFRVYPLAPLLALADRGLVPDRMDFDTEVAVRLYWAGVPVLNLPTRVRYPEKGLSNFRLVRDNARMTLLHIRLILGMLPRIPLLLARRWRRTQHPHV